MPKKRKASKMPKNNEKVFKDSGEDYALVTKMVGNSNVLAKTNDGAEHLCHIRGLLRKNKKHNTINTGDYILIAFRDFSDRMCDVLHKYSEDDVKQLKKSGEILDIDDQTNNTAEDAFEFENTEVVLENI